MSGAARRGGFAGWVSRLEDGAIIRAAFYVMLAGTLSVLYIDYSELSGAVAGTVMPLQPVLPAFDPDTTQTSPGPEITTGFEALQGPLEIVLAPGGVLTLTGTIDVGAAQRFRTEVEARGEYVRTVVLNSPGGSVQDAMLIGTLIGSSGFDTRVDAGALCASSCPLAFAGGKERHATPQSAIGVHQVFAAVTAGASSLGLNAAGDAMSNAQSVTAEVTRHLTGLGVDPALWIHALETPPDRLYYLAPDELVKYKLVTRMAGAGT